MDKKVQEAAMKVLEEMKNMTDEELLAEIEKYKDDPLTDILVGSSNW